MEKAQVMLSFWKENEEKIHVKNMWISMIC